MNLCIHAWEFFHRFDVSVPCTSKYSHEEINRTPRLEPPGCYPAWADRRCCLTVVSDLWHWLLTIVERHRIAGRVAEPCSSSRGDSIHFLMDLLQTLLLVNVPIVMHCRRECHASFIAYKKINVSVKSTNANRSNYETLKNCCQKLTFPSGRCIGASNVPPGSHSSYSLHLHRRAPPLPRCVLPTLNAAERRRTC